MDYSHIEKLTEQLIRLTRLPAHQRDPVAVITLLMAGANANATAFWTENPVPNREFRFPVLALAALGTPLPQRQVFSGAKAEAIDAFLYNGANLGVAMTAVHAAKKEILSHLGAYDEQSPDAIDNPHFRALRIAEASLRQAHKRSLGELPFRRLGFY